MNPNNSMNRSMNRFVTPTLNSATRMLPSHVPTARCYNNATVEAYTNKSFGSNQSNVECDSDYEEQDFDIDYLLNRNQQ